jgi:hypothetical protein
MAVSLALSAGEDEERHGLPGRGGGPLEAVAQRAGTQGCGGVQYCKHRARPPFLTLSSGPHALASLGLSWGCSLGIDTVGEHHSRVVVSPAGCHGHKPSSASSASLERASRGVLSLALCWPERAVASWVLLIIVALELSVLVFDRAGRAFELAISPITSDKLLPVLLLVFMLHPSPKNRKGAIPLSHCDAIAYPITQMTWCCIQKL